MADPDTRAAAPLPHDAYAGLVSRIFALVVDVVVVTLVAAVAVALVAGGARVLLGEIPDWVRTTTGVLIGVLPALYFAGSWWLTGQTPGDMVMGIAVRRNGSDRSLSPLRALLRAVVGLALWPIWLLGMITVLFDERRRALIDMPFGTVVRRIESDRRLSLGGAG